MNYKIYKCENIVGEGEKPLPTKGHSMNICGSNIYIYGGLDSNYRSLNELHCFDTINRKWSKVITTGIKPIEAYNHGSWVWNNKLYIYYGTFSQPLIYSLDLESKEWKKEIINDSDYVIQLPIPKIFYSISLLGNRVFIYGGRDDHQVYSDLYSFNLENNKWDHLEYVKRYSTEYPPTLYGHSSIVIDTNLYIIVGNADGHVIDSVYLFDCVNETFSKLNCKNNIENNKINRFFHSSSIINNNNNNLILSIGGVDETSKIIKGDVLQFNTNTNEWDQAIITGDAIPPRSMHTSVTIDNKIYIFGGQSKTISPTNDLLVLSVEEPI